MADREVQIQLSKMRRELKKVFQSSVAILEEVQGQNPSNWDQFSEMIRTAAVDSDLEEREQSLDMAWTSSLVALGINTKYHLHSYRDLERVDNGPLVIKQWTLRWIDVTTGQEVVATPKMLALAEAQSTVLGLIWNFYKNRLRLRALPGFEDILSTLPSLLLEAADLPCSCLALEELNFALSCELHQVQVTLDGILTILKAVFNELTEEQTQEIEDLKKVSDMEKSCFKDMSIQLNMQDTMHIGLIFRQVSKTPEHARYF